MLHNTDPNRSCVVLCVKSSYDIDIFIFTHYNQDNQDFFKIIPDSEDIRE